MTTYPLRNAAPLAVILAIAVTFVWSARPVRSATEKKPINGRELFTREWLANDTRSAGGDGLGPMFNESSCVACHNQGGLGGGGPESKNVSILSVVALANDSSGNTVNGAERGVIASALSKQAERLAAPKDDKEAKQRLAKLHPAFADARSTVLHTFSLDPAYYEWRQKFLSGVSNQRIRFDSDFSSDTVDIEPQADLDQNTNGQSPASGASRNSEQKPAQIGLRQQANAMIRRQMAQSSARKGSGSLEIDGFVMLISERNTLALFGAGLIDAVSQETLEKAATRNPEFPEISGRVAKLKDGRIGRFGWKAQQSTLHDFTLTACAVELGLNVPNHTQRPMPHKKNEPSANLDMSAEECQSLVGFVRDLPRPVQRTASDEEAEALAVGEKHFKAVGCAACHAPQLGEVAGIYSNLLLHDMGPALADAGVYGGAAPNSSEESTEPLPRLLTQRAVAEPTKKELAKTIGALRQEWRTPPLWGCRDSAPYLHDGRAASLEEAIAFHDGEAEKSALRFFALEDAERQQVIAFLKSLVAPGL